MKQTILISLLTVATFGAFAQSSDKATTLHNGVCRVARNMPADAKPVFPESAYTPLQDPSCPPCYEYKSKYGYMVMECPFLRFPPAQTNSTTVTPLVTEYNAQNGAVEVRTQNTYAGRYPKVCKTDPEMPANGKPVWPTTEYTALGNPECAPCYEYTRKSGLKVMECHNLMFPPEDTK